LILCNISENDKKREKNGVVSDRVRPIPINQAPSKKQLLSDYCYTIDFDVSRKKRMRTLRDQSIIEFV